MRREMVSTVEEQASPRYHGRFARRKVEMFAPRNGVMFGLGMTAGIGWDLVDDLTKYRLPDPRRPLNLDSRFMIGRV